MSTDGNYQEITSGSFEVKDAYWISTEHIAAITSESDPGQHALWLIDVATGKRQLTSDRAVFCANLVGGQRQVAVVTSSLGEPWGIATRSIARLRQGEPVRPSPAFSVHATAKHLLVPEPSVIDLDDGSGGKRRALIYEPDAASSRTG